MSYKVPASIADRLLDLLSEDDDFRYRFEKNAAQCLKDLGCLMPADDSSPGPFCLATRRLATKAQIRNTRATLRHQLVEMEATFNPIGLGVGFGHPATGEHTVEAVAVPETA
jgi:putative modified peptide